MKSFLKGEKINVAKIRAIFVIISVKFWWGNSWTIHGQLLGESGGHFLVEFFRTIEVNFSGYYLTINSHGHFFYYGKIHAKQVFCENTGYWKLCFLRGFKPLQLQRISSFLKNSENICFPLFQSEFLQYGKKGRQNF